MGKNLLVVAAVCWGMLPNVCWARSWTQINPLHGLNRTDPSESLYSMETNPLFTAAPTPSPSTEGPTFVPTTAPTLMPTATPTTEPTAVPTMTPDPYPPNDAPVNPDPWYFNYDTRKGSAYGPGYPSIIQLNSSTFTVGYKENSWGSVAIPPNFYFDEFGSDGFGPWKGVLANRNIRRNRCDRVGMQSPVDVRQNGAICHEHHEVRSRPGDFRVTGDRVEKRIESNKLRLVYERRPCADLNNVTCQEPDPPYGDFPNGWGGFADVMHVDFKVPSEHLIWGERFDAEMQIFHLHPSRRRMPTLAVMIKAMDSGYNYYFQEALKAFQYVYDLNQARCTQKRRRDRHLVSEMHDVLGEQVISEFHDYETWAQFSTELDRPDFAEHSKEMERSLQVRIWDPHHEMLVPTIHFYRYEGSLTEPPCGEWISWFIADVPMIIGFEQLEQMKKLLFTNVDASCRKTSVQFGHSVARPIQETNGRPIYKCTAADFGPDP